MQNKKTRKKSKHSHSGISDLFAAVLLLGITVTGSVIILVFFQNSDLTSITGQTGENSEFKSVMITGFDTRDSTGLSKITGLNNLLDVKGLCTVSCNANKDLIPVNGGTDFIVLKIRNNGAETILISTITINDIIHNFDFVTANTLLVATSNAQNCTTDCPYPKSGKFSVISSTESASYTQKNLPELEPGQDLRFIVKLSPTITNDISLTKQIIVEIQTNRLQSQQFVIPAGATS